MRLKEGFRLIFLLAAISNVVLNSVFSKWMHQLSILLICNDSSMYALSHFLFHCRNNLFLIYFVVAIQQEKEKAMVNEMVAKLTSVCWDKCITSTPGNKFSSSESACLSNCAQRYMDLTLIIMKRVQSMQ
ncbi:hypothetical protein Gotri_008452 [Gossypium trilobum]|uniref:Mitochondrial import inner membrane translocase subunit n=2 Tax=Gossypium TaxID=3633 RepID=A0A7J9EK61_9ROSI|nr:hypothetical protein [Gossypium trilobum]